LGGGILAYFCLGQQEDHDFTFRDMVVVTYYPGATAKEVELQVTDRIEEKLQELPHLNFLRSYSRPGESVVFVTLKEEVPRKDVPYLWYMARKKNQRCAPQFAARDCWAVL